MPGILQPAAAITTAEIAGAWQQALAADRPTVLDVHCDPDVPPIPPHATFEQMKDAALALAKGDRTGGALSKTA